MTRIEHHGPRAAFCLLMLAAPVAFCAQPDLGRTATVEEQIHDRIAAEQAQEGAHSAALIPLFTELGQLYRDLGHEDRAAAAFEAARGVVRANRGFSSLDEAPLLEELIRIEEHLGYAENAWEREQELLALADAHPDDLRAADIYRLIGDKRFELLNRYLAGEFPPQLVLGCYYDRYPSAFGPNGEHNCAAGSRRALINALTTEAWRYYFAAIKTLSVNQLYSSPELRDLETRIVHSSYERGAYSFGRRSLERLLTYDVARAEPLLTRVGSLLEITDWDIVMMRRTGSRFALAQAHNTYEQAYARLGSEGVDPQSIEAMFSPDVPVVLPTFLPNPLLSQQMPDTTGHIDVAFEITKYGRARRVKVLDSTTNAPRQAKSALVRQISSSVFRPRLVDGQVADAAPVVLRYYVTPAPQ
jgi:hypothetical protein